MASDWDELRRGVMPESAWARFHEASKIGRVGMTPEAPIDASSDLDRRFEYVGAPRVDLPEPRSLTASFDAVALARFSQRDFVYSRLHLDELATLLEYSYGVTRDNLQTQWPRPFRVVPSAGALYPLELFVYLPMSDCPVGIYHYEPMTRSLRQVASETDAHELKGCFVEEEVVGAAAALVLITALFNRSTTKYGERGYRFSLLEAGHVAQSLVAVAGALGFGSLCLGGYRDREVDRLLRLDGVLHSTVYAVAVGRDASAVVDGGQAPLE